MLTNKLLHPKHLIINKRTTKKPKRESMSFSKKNQKNGNNKKNELIKEINKFLKNVQTNLIKL